MSEQRKSKSMSILSFSKKLKIIDLIKSKRDIFEKMSYHKIAEVCSAELGFLVTDSNVRSIVKDAELDVGTPIRKRSGRRSKIGGWKHRVLARFVIDIAKQLGVEVPQNVRAISVNRAVPDDLLQEDRQS